MPVPLLLMYAPNWNWILVANKLLGINQGLVWSSTVIMKIDLVGNKNLGLALGINEFAGLASSIAAHYGFAFFPFIPCLAFAALGLMMSVFLIKDTTHFVHAESSTSNISLLKMYGKIPPGNIKI